MKIWLVAGAVVIIVALAAYAAYLHWLLYRRKRLVAVATAPQLDSERRMGVAGPAIPGVQRVTIRRSLYLLADAILDDKLSHTEGCLRICAIAANLEDSERFRIEYGVLFRVAASTAHIPILDAWQALPREEKQRYDKEREGIEAKYTDAVIDAARRIKEQFPL
jgi:hypothetical protein